MSFSHFDLEGLVFLVPSISSGFYTFCPLFQGFPEIQVEGLMVISHLELLEGPAFCVMNVWLWGLYLLSSATGGSFSDDEQGPDL